MWNWIKKSVANNTSDHKAINVEEIIKTDETLTAKEVKTHEETDTKQTPLNNKRYEKKSGKKLEEPIPGINPNET